MSTITITNNTTIVRTWFNGFAETCYEFEDGSILYVAYDGKSVRVEQPKTEKEQ